MRSPGCLKSDDRLTESDLCELEDVAFAGCGVEHEAVQRLIREVRRLKHELADPAYTYAGSRIRRDAILSREATITALSTALSKPKEVSQS